MNKSVRFCVAIGLTALAALIGPLAPPHGVFAQKAAQVAAPIFVYSYAVKFVCGYQPPLQPIAATNLYNEPPVKSGNYATEINIFNPQFKDVPLRKRFIVLSQNGKSIKEPSSTTHVMTMTMGLKSGYATMDDCELLWKLTKVAPPLPPANSLLIGYLVINSPLELDIDAVYTSAAVRITSQPGAPPQPVESNNVDIDVERIPGKRVQLNATHFDNPPPTLP